MIAHRYITKAGWIPSPSELVVGEIVLNFSDQKMWSKDHNDKVIEISPGEPLPGPIRLEGDQEAPFNSEWIILEGGEWTAPNQYNEGYHNGLGEGTINRRDWLPEGSDQLEYIFMEENDWDGESTILVRIGSTGGNTFDGSSSIQFQFEVVDSGYTSAWYNASFKDGEYESILFQDSDLDSWEDILDIRDQISDGYEVICRIKDGGPQ